MTLPTRQVSHSSSTGSLNSESSTPVFRAYLTPPRQRSAFPFPERIGPESDPGPHFPRLEPEPRHREPEPEPPPGGQTTTPKQPYHETEPKYRLHEKLSRQPGLGTNHLSGYHETEPKRPYQETAPKQPLRSESSGRFLFPDPRAPLQTEPNAAGGKPRVPYPGSEPSSSCGEPRPSAVRSSAGGEAPRYPYPGSEPQYAETEPKYVYQETEPKQAAHRQTGYRRHSEAAPERPHSWLRDSGRSQSETAASVAGLLPGDACLDSDQAGSINVSSDMRGLQAHVHGSDHVHLGPKVFDQRNFHIDRVDSHVDNVIQHEHIQTKQEHIQTKHEHVQNKTEVHNRTENIKIERIQHKHDHIQVNTTGIVNNQGGTIYADRVHLHCNCKQTGERRTVSKSVSKEGQWFCVTVSDAVVKMLKLTRHLRGGWGWGAKAPLL